MNLQQLRRSGFSLLELLLVVSIVAIIVSIVIVRFPSNTDLAKTRSCFHNRSELNSAIERWYVQNNAWPAKDLSDLGADATYFPAGIPVCPVTGGAYSMNATTHRVDGHSASTVPGDH